MSDYLLYILIRTDLPTMSPGRACAMASHATNAIMKAYGGTRKDLQEWTKETTQGFGTAIVLSMPNLLEMHRIVGQCKAIPDKEVIADIVTDPDYRISATSEVGELLDKTKIKDYFYEGDLIIISTVMHTCAYAFGRKIILEPILKNLNLYPD